MRNAISCAPHIPWFQILINDGSDDPKVDRLLFCAWDAYVATFISFSQFSSCHLFFSCHVLLSNFQEMVIPIAYSRSYFDLFLYELSICRDYLLAKIKRNTEIFLFQVDIHLKPLSMY